MDPSTHKPVSPLRQPMLDDMAMRKLNPQTQAAYIRAVKTLAQFLGRSPDQTTSEDLRRFQMHLVERGTSSATVNATITGLRFFFEVTLRRVDALEQMSPVREPRTLPVVLSVVEVEQIIAAASSLKYRAALSVAYGAGLRASAAAPSISTHSTLDFGKNGEYRSSYIHLSQKS